MIGDGTTFANTCPNCGYCPHCGRTGGQRVAPPLYPFPSWPYTAPWEPYRAVPTWVVPTEPWADGSATWTLGTASGGFTIGDPT